MDLVVTGVPVWGLARRVLFMSVQHGVLRSPPKFNTQRKTTMKTRLNPGSVTVLLVAASLALPAVAQSTSDQQPQVQTGASTNAQAQAQTANPQTGTGKAP